MGVRARRWQLWLITTFILTGIIGMIQLFKGPESAGAVTIAGGAVNSSIGLPSRSSAEQATQLPAWTPTDDTSAKAQNNGVPKVAAATTRPIVVARATDPEAVTTSRTRATQLPSTTGSPATKTTSVTAKTVTTSASPTTAKPTTTTPAATAATATKAGTTATKAATTTAARPTPTPVRKTTAAPTTSRTQQPTTRCYRILWWVRCR